MKKRSYYSLNLCQYVKVRLQRLYCATLHASVEDDLMVNRKRFPSEGCFLLQSNRSTL